MTPGANRDPLPAHHHLRHLTSIDRSWPRAGACDSLLLPTADPECQNCGATRRSATDACVHACLVCGDRRCLDCFEHHCTGG